MGTTVATNALLERKGDSKEEREWEEEGREQEGMSVVLTACGI